MTSLYYERIDLKKVYKIKWEKLVKGDSVKNPKMSSF